MNIERLIEAAADRAAKKAARETITELKRSGMIVDSGSSRYKRAEELLRNYGTGKNISAEQARRVEQALAYISGQQYADAVQLYYFENLTNAEVAERLHASERTVIRKRQRLVQILSARI
ncbi:MAG: hypothetical protein J6Y26_06500 [Lachnospiraceae bacterium]|nr:hypothetical protein [Kiritimatiellia bacterium]MBP5411538.1 hypothetical protein [Lachnospiraceae bacterium]